MLGAVVFLLIVLPLWALTHPPGLVRLVGQIVLTIDLILVIIGTGLFGYICMKAQARKWGAGLIAVAVLSVLAIYLVWFGHLPFLP
jgi:hypothetical protein